MELRFPEAMQGDAARESVKHVLIRLNPAGWRALKVLALDRDRPMQALAIEAINDLLSKHGRKPVARSPLLREREGDTD